MAILIPSKNIYNKGNIKKTNNIIEKCIIQERTPKTLTYLNDKLYSGNISPNETEKDSYGIDSDVSTGSYNGSTYYLRSVSGYELNTNTINDYYVKLPQNQEYYNRFIKSISNENVEIKLSLKETKVSGTAIYDIKNNKIQSVDFDLSTEEENYLSSLENISFEETILFDLRPFTTSKATATLTAQIKDGKFKITNQVSASKTGEEFTVSTYPSVEIGKIDESGQTYYKVDIKSFLGGFSLTFYNGAIAYVDAPPNENEITATRLKYDLEDIILNVNGETLSLSVGESTVEYGDGKKTFSFQGNEFFQDSATINDTKVSKRFSENIINQYSEDKETVTILCDISDYYDEQNNISKSITDITKDMVFSIGDEVIPFVLGENGKDRPMSVYKNGSRKVFSVKGTNIIYDGAVWQELYLQEIFKNPLQ